MTKRAAGLRGIRTLALFVATGCAPARAVTPERAPNERAAVFESPSLGYSWRLPPGWTFVREETPGSQKHPPAIELTTATREGDRPLTARVVVRSRLSVIAGRWNTAADDEADLERLGIEVLENYGALVTGSRRLEMLGARVVETNGFVETERISVRLLYRGRRVFEFLCAGTGQGSEWPCASAFTAFTIAELPEAPAEHEPRVLHLRDARFALEFDAPDDSWLAIGPSTGMNGAQFVWIWRNAGRQIDVQAADLSSLKIEPDVASFVAIVTKQFERDGMTVTLKKAQLAGESCHHLEVNGRNGYQDMFMLIRNSTLYGLLVTQPTRDTGLVEEAKKRFRLAKR